MKAKNVGGREAIIKNARNTCIVMGEEERDVIEDRKGDQSISEFVRDSIKLRGTSSGNLLIREINELKERNIQILHELEAYKQKETTKERIKAEAIKGMYTGYMHYLEADNPLDHHRKNWISANSKSAGVSSIEFLAYLKTQETVDNVEAKTCRET